jgi:cell division protein FtsQ
MSLTGNIRKIIIISCWSIAGAGVLVLLIAAINHRNTRRCTGYQVEVKANAGKPFIDGTEISRLITAAGTLPPKGRPVVDFDLRKLEDSLRKNPWIKDAQLYFDNNEKLQVNITGREPAVRIFTVGGNSFYLDSAGAQLPLSAKSSATLPVFTRYPAEKITWTGDDSLLTVQVKNIGNYLLHDSFWLAQVQQVEIMPDKTFDLIPLIGNHVICIGEGSDLDNKFKRMMIFYKDVLTKVGFDKYVKIDLRYMGQVVATRKGGSMAKIDSIAAVKNIEQMIRSARVMEEDTLHQHNMKQLEENTLTEQSLRNYDMVPVNADSPLTRKDTAKQRTDHVPVKTLNPPNHAKDGKKPNGVTKRPPR